MITYPLQLDSEGGLLASNDPLDLLVSEVRAILNTKLWTRPLRMDYGSKSYVLVQLELGQLLVDLSTKLTQSLSQYGYTNIQVDNSSTIADLQGGTVKLKITFKYGGDLEGLYYYTSTLNDLRDRLNGNR